MCNFLHLSCIRNADYASFTCNTREYTKHENQGRNKESRGGGIKLEIKEICPPPLSRLQVSTKISLFFANFPQFIPISPFFTITFPHKKSLGEHVLPLPPPLTTPLMKTGPTSCSECVCSIQSCGSESEISRIRIRIGGYLESDPN